MQEISDHFHERENFMTYLLRTVYSYFAEWSASDQDGISVLEWALKKSGWRGPRETGAQRLQHALDHRRAEREEHGHGRLKRL